MESGPIRRWHVGDVVVLRYVETPTSARMVHAVLGDPAGSGGAQPFLVGGEVVTVQARPYRVVRDTDELVVLYQPPGTPLPRWLLREDRPLPGTQLSAGESLRLLYPGRPYDVTLFFESDAGPAPWFFDALFAGEGLQPGWRERRRVADFAGLEPGPAAAPPDRFRGWYVNMDLPFRRTPLGFDIVDMTLDIVVRPDRSWYWKDADELALAVAKGACSDAYAERIRAAGRDVVALIEAAASPFDDEWTAWRAPEDWSISDVPDGWQHLPAIRPD